MKIFISLTGIAAIIIMAYAFIEGKLIEIFPMSIGDFLRLFWPVFRSAILGILCKAALFGLIYFFNQP